MLLFCINQSTTKYSAELLCTNSTLPSPILSSIIPIFYSRSFLNGLGCDHIYISINKSPWKISIIAKYWWSMCVFLNKLMEYCFHINIKWQKRNIKTENLIAFQIPIINFWKWCMGLIICDFFHCSSRSRPSSNVAPYPTSSDPKFGWPVARNRPHGRLGVAPKSPMRSTQTSGTPSILYVKSAMLLPQVNLKRSTH